MLRLSILPTLTLAATLALTGTISHAQASGSFAQSQPRIIQGQWKIFPNGCSYTRAFAPGTGVQWIRIGNPHHIGGATATRRCPAIIQG